MTQVRARRARRPLRRCPVTKAKNKGFSMKLRKTDYRREEKLQVERTGQNKDWIRSIQAGQEGERKQD